MSFVYNHNKLALLGEREYTITPSLKQLGEINDLLRYEFKAIIMLHIINYFLVSFFCYVFYIKLIITGIKVLSS